MLRSTAAIAVLFLLGTGVAIGGCDTRIEESPTEVVELRAQSSIKAAGADPSDWIIEGSCIGMGPCSATVFAATYPDLKLAQSSYTVKDSRAFPKTPNGIAEAAARASERDCFDRGLTAARLETCVTGE